MLVIQSCNHDNYIYHYFILVVHNIFLLYFYGSTLLNSVNSIDEKTIIGGIYITSMKAFKNLSLLWATNNVLAGAQVFPDSHHE